MAQDLKMLQALICEFHTLNSGISNIAVFKRNGEVLASSGNITKEQARDILSDIEHLKLLQTIGDIESLTVQDSTNQLNLVSVDDTYLVTVCSRSVDPKMVKSLTQVIAPSAIRLALGAAAKALQNAELKVEGLPPNKASPPKPEENPNVTNGEPIASKALAVQFMVSKISGFLVASDTVRVSNHAITKWGDFYGASFGRVCLETLNGRTLVCKFKPLKDKKLSGKGAIQVPAKILAALDIDSGDLVTVKPVVE